MYAECRGLLPNEGSKDFNRMMYILCSKSQAKVQSSSIFDSLTKSGRKMVLCPLGFGTWFNIGNKGAMFPLLTNLILAWFTRQRKKRWFSIKNSARVSMKSTKSIHYTVTGFCETRFMILQSLEIMFDPCSSIQRFITVTNFLILASRRRLFAHYEVGSADTNTGVKQPGKKTF